MKKIFLVLFLFISSLCFSQSNEYKDLMEELYYNRQPSPRAEAMGRGLSADNQNDFGLYYNPALTSLGQGLKVNVSFSNKYKYYEKGNFNSLNISYNLKNIGSFGFSRYGIKFSDKGIQAEDSWYPSIYTLNYSREIIKDFYAGVNLNGVVPGYISQQGAVLNHPLYTIDIGLLKKFTFYDSTNKVFPIISVGGSIININETKFHHTNPVGNSYVFYLPTIARIAASVNFIYKKNTFINNLDFFNVLLHLEYENTLNSRNRNAFKGGLEIGFSDILFIRGGALNLNTRNKSVTDSDYGKQESTETFGAGVKIPIDLIFKLKTSASIALDYTNLKLNKYDTDRFHSFAVKLNYIPNF